MGGAVGAMSWNSRVEAMIEKGVMMVRLYEKLQARR